MPDTKISALSEATTLVDDDELPVVTNVSTTPVTKRSLMSTLGVYMAAYITATIHAATGKTTPVDADEIPLLDSAASYVKKKLTWANLKATLKTYFDALYLASTALNGEVTIGTFLTLNSANVTIASDTITATSSIMVVDTEAGAAADNLATINGFALGRLLIIRSANNAHDVTVKDATGNLQLASDCILGNVNDQIMFVGTGAGWREVSRSINT